jgi:Insertion element 4 transposase N-terminal
MVAGGRFAPGHLGELTQQVPFEMVDAVLEETRRVQRRVRDLPARVVAVVPGLGRCHEVRGWRRADRSGPVTPRAGAARGRTPFSAGS